MVDSRKVKKLLELSRRLKILYVEDDIGLQSSMLNVLSNFFSNIFIASDGQEGFELYTEHFKTNDTFDIIITDLDMPELNGIEMSKKILDLNKNQKIIITTAFSSKKEVQEFVEENDNIVHVLDKPIEVNNFLKLLLELLKI